jgi:hypothetical protein
MDKIIELLDQWAGVALLSLLGLTLLFSALWGLGRGFKRSWMRLLSIIIFVGVAFLITPAITRAVYNSQIKVYEGQTVSEFVDGKIEEVAEDNSDLVSRVRTIMPDFETFIMGSGFAVVNIVIFFVLCILALGFSWIIYAIFAKIFAPKREKPAKGVKVKKRNREKIPQHRGLGLVIGVVQGFVMFTLFLVALPIGGSLSVVHSIAQHKPFDGEVTLDTTRVSANDDFYVNSDSNEMTASEIFDTIEKVDNAFHNASVPAKIYSGLTKWSGIQGLSRAMFDYQMTVKLDNNAKIVLSKDLVSGANLTEDVLTFMDRIDTIGAGDNDFAFILENMTDDDYKATEIIIDEVFDLSIFAVVKASIKNIDEFLAAGDKNTQYYDVTGVQQNSFYADIADNYAIPTHEKEFIAGLRAVVNNVGHRSLDILRDDIKNYIEIAKYVFKAETETGDTIYRALSGAKKDDDSYDYLKIVELLSANAPTPAKAGNTLFMELADRVVLKSSFLEILSTKDAEKIIINGTFDGQRLQDIKYDGKVVVSKDNLAKFVGQTAVGQWTNAFNVVDGFVVAGAQFTDLPIDGGQDAIMDYVMDETKLTKAKIDNIADALFDAVTIFGKENSPYSFLNAYLTEYDIPKQELGKDNVSEIDLNKMLEIDLNELKNEFLQNFFGTAPAVDDDLTTTDKNEYRPAQGTKQAWEYQFNSAVEIGRAVWGVYEQINNADFDMDLTALIGKDSPLWDLIGDEIVGQLADIIEEQLNNLSPDVNISFGENPVEAISSVANIIADVIDIINEGGSSLDLAEALVGDVEHPDFTDILAIADSGVYVELAGDTFNNTMNSIADAFGDGVTYDPQNPTVGLQGTPTFSAQQLTEWGLAPADDTPAAVEQANKDLVDMINGLLHIAG